MSASKSATPLSSREITIGSDLAKVDAHEITQEEYDEIPELTDEMVGRADFYVGKHFVGHGLPGSAQGPVSIYLTPVIVDHFRETGTGWQARVNDILLEVVERERTAREKAKAD